MVIGNELMQTVVSEELRFSRGLRSLQFVWCGVAFAEEVG